MYGFFYNRQFYFYQHGFDDRYSRHSIGLVLMALTLRAAIDEGARGVRPAVGHRRLQVAVGPRRQDASPHSALSPARGRPDPSARRRGTAPARTAGPPRADPWRTACTPHIARDGAGTSRRPSPRRLHAHMTTALPPRWRADASVRSSSATTASSTTSRSGSRTRDAEHAHQHAHVRAPSRLHRQALPVREPRRDWRAHPDRRARSISRWPPSPSTTGTTTTTSTRFRC